MFATIRRHQKWLWGVIIVLVIVAFVIFMGPNAGTGMQGGRNLTFGSINGRDISQEELMNAYAEIRLKFRLLSGRWPEQLEGAGSWFDPDRLMQERLIMLEKVRELGIKADIAAEADWIANVFRDPQRGTFSPELYKQFVATELPQGRLSETDLRRMAQNEAAIQQVADLASIPGQLVSPRIAEAEFRRTHEMVTTELALFSLSNHLAEVQIDPDELSRYFTNNSSRYREPERLLVNYVDFPTTNYLEQAEAFVAKDTNLNEIIDFVYQQRGADAFRDESGAILDRDGAQTKIREEYVNERAMTEARLASISFAEELYARYEETNNVNHLAELAAEKGMTSSVTEPFARYERPTDITAGTDFAQSAFALSEERPMAMEPVLGTDRVYLMTYRDTVPSRVPPMEAVRIRVTADLRREKALEAARAAGEAFYQKLTNAVAQGRSFSDVCAEDNVAYIKPAGFSLSSDSLPGLRREISFTQLKDLAFALEPGDMSGFVSTSTGGMVAHVMDRLPVDDAAVEAGLADYLAELREQGKRDAVNAWFRKQAALTTIVGLPRFSRDE